MLGIGNQQDLSDDLECDLFLNTAMQRFTCDLYYCFGAFLAPVSVGIITGKHYTKNSGTKLNGRSNNGNCESAGTRNCNKTEIRKKEELKHLNEQITKQDVTEHKPDPHVFMYMSAVFVCLD